MFLFLISFQYLPFSLKKHKHRLFHEVVLRVLIIIGLHYGLVSLRSSTSRLQISINSNSNFHNYLDLFPCNIYLRIISLIFVTIIVKIIIHSQNIKVKITIFTINVLRSIFDDLRNLVPFVQFKKLGKLVEALLLRICNTNSTKWRKVSHIHINHLCQCIFMNMIIRLLLRLLFLPSSLQWIGL